MCRPTNWNLDHSPRCTARRYEMQCRAELPFPPANQDVHDLVTSPIPRWIATLPGIGNSSDAPIEGIDDDKSTLTGISALDVRENEPPVRRPCRCVSSRHDVCARSCAVRDDDSLERVTRAPVVQHVCQEHVRHDTLDFERHGCQLASLDLYHHRIRARNSAG